jgi:hypothetical protein
LLDVKLTKIIKDKRFSLYINHSDDKNFLFVLEDPKVNSDKQRKRPKIFQAPVKNIKDDHYPDEKSVRM